MVRFEDVLHILEPLDAHDDAILIGGQALNFWGAFYAGRDASIRDKQVLLYSGDIDFLGGRYTEDAIFASWDCDRRRMGNDSYSPLDSKLKLRLADKRYIVIDFLNEMVGVDNKSIKTHARTTHSPTSGKPLKVLHPLHCMISRVHNTYGEIDRRSRQYSAWEINRVRLSIRVLHHYLVDQLTSDNAQIRDTAFSLIDDIAEEATREPALRAFYMDQVDVLDSIPSEPGMGLTRTFLDSTLPDMKKALNRLRERYASARQPDSDDSDYAPPPGPSP